MAAFLLNGGQVSANKLVVTIAVNVKMFLLDQSSQFLLRCSVTITVYMKIFFVRIAFYKSDALAVVVVWDRANPMFPAVLYCSDT